MNFYDKVHDLVKFFKDTDEYKNFIKLKNEIKRDEKKYAMIKDFKDKQNKYQMDYISTGKIDKEKLDEMENLYSIIIQKEDLRSLLEYEMKLNVLLADMQKIFGDSVKEIIEF